MKITTSVLKSITEHGRRELPLEACGYLAQKNGIVTKHYEMRNQDHRGDHFTMDPREQFAAVKDMRESGLKLAAVYHSHPETPARPSEEDIRLAYDPEISYVIISLADQGKTVVKSFKIRKGKVSHEVLEPVDSTGSHQTSTETQENGDPMKTKMKVDAYKDCEGVGCPMNLVHAKVELAKLQSGQVLEIILDDGPPVNNVPESAAREGHTILEKTRLDNGTWSVLIRKT